MSAQRRTKTDNCTNLLPYSELAYIGETSTLLMRTDRLSSKAARSGNVLAMQYIYSPLEVESAKHDRSLAQYSDEHVQFVTPDLILMPSVGKGLFPRNKYLKAALVSANKIEILTTLVRFPGAFQDWSWELAMYTALRKGHLDAAKLTFSRVSNIDILLAYGEAILSGCIVVLDWLFYIFGRVAVQDGTIEIIIKRGLLEQLIWLKKPEHMPSNFWENSSGRRMTYREAFAIAMEFGHTHIVTWLLQDTENDFNISLMFNYAIDNGFLKIVQYLHDYHGCVVLLSHMKRISAEKNFEMAELLTSYLTCF